MVVLQHILLTMRIYWIGSLDISWLGYFGVFLFFIHTSLVLMWSLERNSDPVGFYVRRAFRIYPLAVLTILVMITFHLPAIRNGNGDAVYWAPGLKNIIANLLLVQNLFWGPEILGVMWSLPMECDMYIMLPFLFSLTAGRSAIWRLLFLWLAIVGMNSYLLPAQSAIFPMFIPHFLAGILAYILFPRVQPRLPGFTLPLLVLGSLSLFLSFPSMRIAWGFTLGLALSIPFFRPIRAKWLVTATHQVAKYSYGIYLVHPFCVVLGLRVLHGHSLPIRLAGIFVPLAGIVVPAYHFVEKPLIDLGARLSRKESSNAEKVTQIWNGSDIPRSDFQE